MTLRLPFPVGSKNKMGESSTAIQLIEKICSTSPVPVDSQTGGYKQEFITLVDAMLRKVFI
jgi:hypothetical protein